MPSPLAFMAWANAVSTFRAPSLSPSSSSTLAAMALPLGSGLSVATIKEVGHRPLLQGILLWLLVSVGSVWLIRAGWIAL